jgi:hypothetical protein
MVIASDYPFLGILWSMLIFFLWVSWFVILFQVIGDLMRRHDASGWLKTAWLIFLVLIPFIGVFAYLIVNGDNMAKRNNERAQAAQDRFVASLPATGPAPVEEIARAKELLDSGAITQAEFESIKAKALA